MSWDRKTLAERQAIAERYHDNLTEDTLAYLKRRGITREVADRFLFGTCDDIYPGRLAIPYLRRSGVIAFKYRATDDSQPKYVNTAGAGTHLFNTADFEKADVTGQIAISEGEIDAVVASALHGIPCVGIPGATQWQGNPHWRELFTGYQRVWVLADPDEAGLGLASAILDSLPAARLVRLPKDVNDCHLDNLSIKEFLK